VNAIAATRLQCLTKVILLFDPEHLTAINTRYSSLPPKYRKRLIQKQIITPAPELHFLNIIFTSPLPRHAKSFTLWTHRRFVIDHLCLQMPWVPPLQDEMRIILRAAETHPKNYHAWTYARYIWQFLWEHPNPEANWQLPQLNHRISTWCKSNVSDISGWMFYLWFLGSDRPWLEPLEKLISIPIAVRSVLELSGKVAPGHDALWAFLTAFSLGVEEVMIFEDRVFFVENMRFYLRMLLQRRRPSVLRNTEIRCVHRMLKWAQRAGLWEAGKEYPMDGEAAKQALARLQAAAARVRPEN
jgi:hypothetical protein